MANLIYPVVFLTLIIYAATGSLVHLGDIEGKAYYVENTTKMGWAGAHSYCLENGMRQATVENKNEADFLPTVVTELEQYWVYSKRLEMAAMTHSWNSQGVNITYDVKWNDSSSGSEGYCAGFYVYTGSSELTLSHGDCFSKYPFTLCEGQSSEIANSIPMKTVWEAKQEKVEQKRAHQNINFTHVGDVEGKAFYSAQAPSTLYWPDAYEYCEEGNMSLAKVESEVQAQFLADNAERNHYWVAINTIDYSEREWKYNSTGAFFHWDMSWATNGRVDDPQRFSCGLFYSYENGTVNTPEIVFMSCLSDFRDFLCHVDI